MRRIFLLSPANCNGARARWIVRPNARSELALRLRGPAGAPLGEVFAVFSALYFRGKLAYARAFARPPVPGAGIFVITPTRGLLSCDAAVRVSTLRGFARVPVHKNHRLYRRSLVMTARALSTIIGADCEVVLLGSIASGKYLDILTDVFGARLRVPADFIGLGDMSRGGLMLRCVREERELEYIAAERAYELARQPRSARSLARVSRLDRVDDEETER